MNWVAYMKGMDIVAICNPSTDETKYTLYWDVLLGKFIQQTGAQGYIYNSISTKIPLYTHIILPNINKQDGTIFGTKVTMFASQIYAYGDDVLLLDQLISLNQTIWINATDDINELEVNFTPYSFFRILCGFMIVVCIFSTFQSLYVYTLYSNFEHKWISISFYRVSIIACFISNFVRIIYFISPLSVLDVPNLTIMG